MILEMDTTLKTRQLFDLQKRQLRFMGHNMYQEKGSKRIGLQHIASLILVISAQYPMARYVIYHSDNMELMTACLSIMFTNLLTVIKILTFLSYKRTFYVMMREFNVLHNESQYHGEAKQYLNAANRLATRLSKVYSISLCFTGFYFMLGPIVSNIRNSFHGVLHHVRDLPMPMKFPFNAVDTPGYEFCYFYTVIVTLTVISFAAAIDGLFISFAINLRGHFQVLQHFLRTIDSPHLTLSMEHKLAEFVKYHHVLLNLAEKLSETFLPVVFGQFLITSLQVCVIIYQIVTHMDSIMSLVVYFSFFCSIMLQLFLYCYGGEIIKTESLMISIAIQLSNWYKLSPHQRKMLQLIMLRSQRPTLIKAIFYEASLANFTSIIRAAVSYITLLQSIE